MKNYPLNPLESCEYFIHALLDSMGEGVLVLDTDFSILATNRSFLEISGEKEEEIIGRYCYEVTHQTDTPCWEIPDNSIICPAKEAIKTGKPVSAIHSHYDRNKRLHYIEIKAYPLTDQNGGVFKIIETHTDITEKKTLEAHLVQAEKMESLGNMAGGIAHDLNNILTPILGNAELALRKMSAGDSYYESFQEIHQAASKASDLVSHILAFSSHQLLEVSPLDLNRIIINLNKFLKRITRKNINIKEYLADDIYAIKADKTQIEQIIMNLVINAGDAMPEGGDILIETSKIDNLQATCSTCGKSMSGSYTILQLTDEGTGIPPEILPHIFEPFFTTKEAGEGTGMGLATIVGIAHQHSGHIDVHSEPGKGATFRLYLPGHVFPENLQDEQPQDHAASKSYEGGNEIILLVDDDENVRQVIEKILTRFGYRVFTAEDGEKALDLFSRLNEKPALIITDVVMAGMDGMELIARIHESQPGMPALFMSGYGLDALHRSFILDQNMNYIQKPVSMEEILAKVRSILSDKS